MWRKLILFTIFVVLLAAGVVSLIWNKGLYYTFYNNGFVVQVVEAAPQGTLDSIGSLRGAASIDRSLAQIQFQNISQDVLTAQLAEVTTDNTHTISSVINYLPGNWLIRQGLAVLMFVVIAIAYIYWTTRQLKLQITTGEKLIVVRNFLLVSGIYFLQVIGTLSLISTVYNVTEITLLMLGLASLIWSLNWGKTVEQTLANWDTFETEADVWTFMQLNLSAAARRIAWLGLIAVSVLSFGLGSKFVVEGAILATFLLLGWITILLWSTGDERIWTHYSRASGAVISAARRVTRIKRKHKALPVKPAEVKAKRIEKKAKAVKVKAPTSKKKSEKKRRN